MPESKQRRMLVFKAAEDSPTDLPHLYANMVRVAYGPEDITVHFYRVDGIDLAEAMKTAKPEDSAVDAPAARVGVLHLPFGTAERLRHALDEVLQKRAQEPAFSDPTNDEESES